jgi:hypothetical protein
MGGGRAVPEVRIPEYVFREAFDGILLLQEASAGLFLWVDGV